MAGVLCVNKSHQQINGIMTFLFFFFYEDKKKKLSRTVLSTKWRCFTSFGSPRETEAPTTRLLCIRFIFTADK